MGNHDPKAILATGEKVGDKPFFTLVAPSKAMAASTRISKVSLPRIPGDIASGSLSKHRTYGESGTNHTVARFQAPVGTKILGISQKFSYHYVSGSNHHFPELILQVPVEEQELEEMEIHLLYSPTGKTKWSPEPTPPTPPAPPRRISYGPREKPALPPEAVIPDGLSYLGAYCYGSYAYELVFVFQPEQYLAAS